MRASTPYIAATVAILCTVAGCTFLQAIRPALPAIAAALLAELDNVLDSYEDTASAYGNDPAASAGMEDLQTARRVLIECIIDDLAENYPEINLTRRLERLNDATGLPPP